MKCIQCGKEFDGRKGAKCCSPTCRSKYKRATDRISVAGSVASATGNVTDKLSVAGSVTDEYDKSWWDGVVFDAEIFNFIRSVEKLEGRIVVLEKLIAGIKRPVPSETPKTYNKQENGKLPFCIKHRCYKNTCGCV